MTFYSKLSLSLITGIVTFSCQAELAQASSTNAKVLTFESSLSDFKSINNESAKLSANESGAEMKDMQEMDHSKMGADEMSDMKGMDHSKMGADEMGDMKGMDHSKMKRDKKMPEPMKGMKGMDHSKMSPDEMKDMKGMDHSKMGADEMKEMKAKPKSTMPAKDKTLNQIKKTVKPAPPAAADPQQNHQM